MDSKSDYAVAALQGAESEKADEVEALASRLAAAREELRRIQKALTALDPAIGQARKEAAPAWVDVVHDLLAEKGPMSKAAISKAIGGHRSRATYAVNALAKRGAVQVTGEDGRSPVYELLAS